MPLGRAFLFLLALCPAVLEGCMASTVPEKKIWSEIGRYDTWQQELSLFNYKNMIFGS
jgi:hypothetical protein